MEVISLEIEEVKLIRPRVFPDERGFFLQSWHERQYQDAGIKARFVQDNWSRSTRGVLRGLHYQLKNAQAKLITVVQGEIFDVAVDIRKGSPTYGRWVGAVLSEENHHQLFVPKGFAHGFLVMSDEVDLLYKCDDFYTPGDEYGLRWDDPQIAIEWPEHAGEFVLSEKDMNAPRLAEIPLAHHPDYVKKILS